MKPSKKNQELKVYGRRAVEALFRARPLDLIRVYLTQENFFLWKPLLKFCAEQKLAYHVVEKEELDTISKSTHHEGICVLARVRPAPKLEDLFSRPGRSLIVALESVENPHNLGAIMRTAAHFGVTAIIYEAKVPVAQSSATLRTAEGGGESVDTVRVEDWAEVFSLAKKCSFHSIGTSSHEGASLFEGKFPEKSLLFLGAEGEGLSGKLKKKLQGFISIPGTGSVESLNVSNAAAVVLSEWFRQGVR